MAQLLLPFGPFTCKTCGRELLIIADATSEPGVRDTVRDQCGAEHFSPGRCVGLYWRDQDGNWLEVPRDGREQVPAA